MTVAELIKKLQELPQETQVILQKDAEGNGYYSDIYVEEGIFSEEYGAALHPDDVADYKDAKPSIFVFGC